MEHMTLQPVDTNPLIKQRLKSFLLLSRLQEVRELANVPSCWEALRCSIVNHCELLIGCYQETLSELERLSGIMLQCREQCEGQKKIAIAIDSLSLSLQPLPLSNPA